MRPHSPFLLAAALLASAFAPANAAAKPELKLFDSAAAALDSLLATRPRVIGFGEYHEIEGGPIAKTALAHFREELLARVAPQATDLIVETWVTEGDCGAKEAKVVEQVAETTKRPEATESDIVKLLKEAKAARLQPHILNVSCPLYQSLLDEEGEVDFEKLLGAITELLRAKIRAQWELRRYAGDKAVLVYGGALHNDLFPQKDLRAFTFGPWLAKETRGKYLEVDLYVPEFIARDKQIVAEPWYPLLKKVPPGKTALVRRGKDSFILVFAKAGPTASSIFAPTSAPGAVPAPAAR